MATFITLTRGYATDGVTDLSAKYGCAVKLNGSKQVVLGAVAGESGVGILVNKPGVGQTAEVMHLGVSPVLSGAAFSALDLLTTDVNGKLVTAVAGNKVYAKALAAATGADQLIEALVLPTGIA